MRNEPAVPDTAGRVKHLALSRGLAFVENTLGRQPPWVILSLSLAMSVGIGWTDFLTGWEVSLFIFYAIPVALAGWFINSRAGLAVSLFDGLVWWIANLDSNPYHTGWGYSSAMLNRLGYFAFVAIGANFIRMTQQSDAGRIRILEEKRRLEQEILKAGEFERSRIGRDIHDGLCQQLAAIGCAVRMLAEDLHLRTAPETADAEQIEGAIQDVLREARSVAIGICPVHLDQHGLPAALQELVLATTRLTGIPVSYRESSEVQVGDRELATHFYRIAQEALSNAVRHGRAKKIEVSLELVNDDLELRIDDDGKGLPAGNGDYPTGMGLRTMGYRADAVGANLTVKPRDGGGTSVKCRGPIQGGKPSD